MFGSGFEVPLQICESCAIEFTIAGVLTRSVCFADKVPTADGCRRVATPFSNSLTSASDPEVTVDRSGWDA